MKPDSLQLNEVNVIQIEAILKKIDVEITY